MDKFFSYQHRIQYYETDGMRIVHHSNYIRWMEEARTAMMEQLGYGYDQMERDGISIPVISVSCEYKEMMHFGQTCRVDVRVTAVSQVRMSVSYEFYDAETGHLCGTGSTGHCFIGQNGRPVSLRKKLPDIYNLFCSMLCTQEEA
ncbi:acyl-CoA thioesterase [Butyricicoccus sp.]|uniref:acyl-CoA thioesterase n=1 Tax=Butyricicoccus sp. TaxID=2049021 RepID=UPI003F135526